MVQISARLKAIADMVPEGLSVADIGCDHGFVSMYLVENRHSPKAIAMDINEGPLIRAREHIEEYGFENNIETRLSDGADMLKVHETDAAVIAGMGGRLIIKILDKSPEVFKAMNCIVLSPHSDIDKVRAYLSDNSFVIDDENMVFDEGKYYTIIRCSYNAGENIRLNETELSFGPKLIDKKHAVLRAYLEAEDRKMVEISDRITGQLEAVNNDGQRKALSDRLTEIEDRRNIIENTLCKVTDVAQN